ncbi:hypothetical protein EX30DRAFT_371764 [Ascodesmis nigricans]|uniref:Centromere protein X n=1 Tax=Ascodesmis nigricans TaxID=341454 RepID=A0A4S2MWN9_9PEZI|nr:hypothetical protein EX30DRAFT_371764 [Ascodesmis nigricans]
MADDDKPDEIPRQLLQRIIHEFRTDKKTRISEPALEALAEYIKIFIQEAVHRAAAEKKRELKGQNYGRLGSTFLEVEDLEKIAPQLLLDF